MQDSQFMKGSTVKIANKEATVQIIENLQKECTIHAYHDEKGIPKKDGIIKKVTVNRQNNFTEDIL